MGVECNANCLHNCDGHCELEDVRLEAREDGGCGFYEERDRVNR